ncbi:sensor histidine kinase [Psychromonas ossibalaenae]|uniref:sensor histidine kinase n=1 Tax=Psychromonas ossibalaenae TaxID=444922 RepID=UPI000366CB0E|nr:HAMP domain-containing sensor histidine kinase [Psychromonas ossibalaenae]
MPKVKSAKQITFTYFSIVAFAIIATHFSLLRSTLEDLEHLNAQNRLNDTKQAAQELLANSHKNSLDIPPFSSVYVGEEAVPQDITLPENLEFNKALEIRQEKTDSTEYFIMKTRLTIRGQLQTVYIFYLDEIYEFSEEQMFGNQAKQLLISIILLLISFAVVSRISQRLTSPLSALAEMLKKRSPHDLSPIPLPRGVETKELLLLVDSVNQYQARLHDSIERERSFNRYASHELRTPLMVIKGAVSLLGQSNEPLFIEKQRRRLLSASNEMNDFVTTLLSLTRDEDLSNLVLRSLEKDEIENIVSTHSHLIANKPVSCEVTIKEAIQIKVPETTIKILIGNLIKNAFACTEQGLVSIYVSPDAIEVIDTGVGLDAKPRGIEGYGLGLVIANDICRKYGWQLDLANNSKGGCTAAITLQPHGTPSGQRGDN